jgi:hypothetical protein
MSHDMTAPRRGLTEFETEVSPPGMPCLVTMDAAAD